MGVTTLEIMSPEELLRIIEEGEISYDVLIAALPQFSKVEQQRIMETVHQIQWQFWNDPETVYYYRVVHPKLPFIDGHFDSLLAAMSIKNDGIIVDLGCGYGKLIQRILANGQPQKIIGIDFASRMIEEAEALFAGDSRVELIEGDFSKRIPLEASSAALLIANWSVVYLGGNVLMDTVFPEIYRVLRPGGRFVCTGLIKGRKMSALAKLKSIPFVLHKMGVIKAGVAFDERLRQLFPIYSVEEMKSMIEGAGFKIVGVDYTIQGRSMMITVQKT